MKKNEEEIKLVFEPQFEKLKEQCTLLNEYITEARYPGDLPFESIGEDEAKEVIRAAEEIEQVLKSIDLPNRDKPQSKDSK